MGASSQHLRRRLRRFLRFCDGSYGSGRRGQVVRERHVAGGAEATDVCAVLVFDPEERPHAAAADFAQGDDEAEEGRVLGVMLEDGVEYPVEAEEGVEEHGYVIEHGVFVPEDFAQEGVFGVGV